MLINRMKLKEMYGNQYSEELLEKYELMESHSAMELADDTEDVETLIILSFSENSWVRMSVAENVNSPVEVLEMLSQDKSNLVQSSVAKNCNCPENILRYLFKVSDPLFSGTNTYIAMNRNCPLDILYKLTLDPMPNVNEEAWINASSRGINSIEDFQKALAIDSLFHHRDAEEINQDNEEDEILEQ